MKAEYIDPALYNIAIQDIPLLEKEIKRIVEGEYKHLKIYKIVIMNVYGDGYSPRFVAFNNFKITKENILKFHMDLIEAISELEPLDPQLYSDVNLMPIQDFEPNKNSTEEDKKIYKELINDTEHIIYQKYKRRK